MPDTYIFETLPDALVEAIETLNSTIGIDTKSIKNLEFCKELAQNLIETIENHPDFISFQQN